MSDNKKDDADRRAEELVSVEKQEINTGSMRPR